MTIEKLELDASPKAYEVLSVVKTNYRSGKRYEITVRFNWKITPSGAKFLCYTDVVSLLWDRASETVADLKAKAMTAFNALKLADTSDADLVFNLLHLTV